MNTHSGKHLPFKLLMMMSLMLMVVVARTMMMMRIMVMVMQVIGIPHERLGEEVCAWIQLKSGETATDEELKDFCKQKASACTLSRLSPCMK